ncbi:aldehyde dehydrogenase family protein [Mycolicibacterium sp.]|uniref:aldehyde dehydrogenase family protein n=1 Tax=Mycolicibacterium sp. TaxID=2320850 RepID=UPI003D0F9C0B
MTNTIERVDYTRLFVGGEWVRATGEEFVSVDPYRMRGWATVGSASPADVQRTIDAARRAARPWRRMSGYARSQLLFQFADALDAQRDRLAEIETRDNGKLYKENYNQIGFAVRNFRFFAGLADKLTGETKPLDSVETVDFTTREPHGVVVLIAPWNSPIQTLSNKLAPALTAGNTVIIKPSEYTSASTLELAGIFEAVGFPPGVVNVVTGGAATGEALTTNPGVDMISFTGGIGTARVIAANAARNVIPLTLELGGKGANIIFEDANLDRAVPGAVSGIFAATGQTCVAGSRLLVHESRYDEVVAAVARRAEAIRLGDPMDEQTQMGPMANENQYRHVLRMIAEAKEDGAELITGGGPPPDRPESLFVAPTVFGRVDRGSRLANTEVFGPVLAAMPFRDEDDAIALANGTDYGLAAGLWTQDINRALRVAGELDTGTVWINTYRTSASQAPFGGVKRSGYGRERGTEGLTEYTRVKNTMIDLSETVRDPFVLGT